MPTVFRPCIDLHSGKVKQIVGGSLNDKDESALRTNFVSSEPPSYYANLYRQHNLTGAHVIKLGPGNDEAASECLRAWPDGLQIGGGITAGNAQAWIDAGAAKVIVTSYLFPGAKFSLERLEALSKVVGKERLVVDVSCRRRGSEWIIAMDKWQTLTDMTVNKESLDLLANYCSEFLVHAADVEGLCRGIDEDLVKALGKWTTIPTTYAGGAYALSDLDLVDRLSGGKVDLTFGSALDIFGGKTVKFDECVAHNHNNMNKNNVLDEVIVQSNVLHVLFAHAFSTEKEEIMGMLMGDWVQEGSKQVARVDGVSLLTRTEKRKDRVEIGPEQLSMAAIEAEEITKSSGKTTRVIGWSNKVQVTCFQSRDTDSGCMHVKLPFSVVSENPLESLTLPKLLEVSERIYEEQRQSFYRSIPKKYRKKKSDMISGNHTGSSAKKLNTGPWSGSPASEYPPSNPFGRDIGAQSPSALSSAQPRGWDPEGDTIMLDADSEAASLRRKASPAPLNRSDTGMSEDIPGDDLRTEYIDADAMTLPDKMTWIRNSGVYVQSLASLMDNLVGPTLQTLVEREQYNLEMTESLKRQKQELLRQLQLDEAQRSGNLVNLLDE
ncbi:Enzyme that catalyzes the fourth step in the histidine pathway [Actinomortierella ambigua]|nr:Enzyme that catalyzes the fourth step in the histidine pathway [Actinomortierella ambigua]